MSAADLKVLPGPGSLSPPVTRATPTPPVRFRGRRRWWAIATLAALLVVGIAAEAWRASTAAMPVSYVTTAVTRGAVTRAVTASGSVNPEITIQVGTYVSGVIQELRCDYNTQVRKGQLCAKIDARPYQMIVDQDEANLSAAKAQLAKDQTNVEYARLTYDRTAGLRERGIVSQDTLDGAKSAYDQATAQVELDKSNVTQHEAGLRAANLNIDYTNIISPVDGTVVSRNVTMGQTVAASFQTPTLFLIATDLTKMQVDANVSESDIGGIRVGNTSTFTVEAFPNHVFEGRVTQVRQAPQTVQNVVTYDVVISVRNPDLLLKPGMTATVRIIVDSRDDVVRVPDQALRYAPGGLKSASAATAPANARARVWILREGRPVVVPITTGLDDDTQTEVVEGELKPGDEVVVSEQSGGGSTASRSLFFRL
jgi:HlyD family secretion protein